MPAYRYSFFRCLSKGCSSGACGKNFKYMNLNIERLDMSVSHIRNSLNYTFASILIHYVDTLWKNTFQMLAILLLFLVIFFPRIRMEHLIFIIWPVKKFIIWYFTPNFTFLLPLHHNTCYCSFSYFFSSCFLLWFKCCSANCIWEINLIWPLLLTVKIFRIN